MANLFIRTPEYMQKLDALRTKVDERRKKYKLSSKIIAAESAYAPSTISNYLKSLQGNINALHVINRAIDRIIGLEL